MKKSFIFEYNYSGISCSRRIKAKDKDEAIRKFNKETKKLSDVEFIKYHEAPYID